MAHRIVKVPQPVYDAAKRISEESGCAMCEAILEMGRRSARAESSVLPDQSVIQPEAAPIVASFPA